MSCTFPPVLIEQFKVTLSFGLTMVVRLEDWHFRDWEQDATISQCRILWVTISIVWKKKRERKKNFRKFFSSKRINELTYRARIHDVCQTFQSRNSFLSRHLRPPEMCRGVTIRVNLPAQTMNDIYRGLMDWETVSIRLLSRTKQKIVTTSFKK